MPIYSAAAPAVLATMGKHFTHPWLASVQMQAGNDALNPGGSGATDLSGRLTGLTITASLDNPFLTGTFTFSVGRGPASLNPLISTSPRQGFAPIQVAGAPIQLPVIRPHNLVSIGCEIAATPFDLFTGRIDRVSVSGDELTLVCRDFGAYLQEAAIRETAIYGLSGGRQDWAVMQDLLEDNGWSSFQLDVADASDFMLIPYPVGEIGTFEAMRRIAQQAGRDVRWFPNGWRGRPGGPLVHYYDPDRARTVPDATIPADRIERVSPLEWGDEDVRNDWNIYYRDPSTGKPVGPFNFVSADSIALYSRRKARIFLDGAENISNDAQANVFGAAALADNQDPFASLKANMAFYPNVTLGDLYLWEANPRQGYDEAQTFAVAAYQHQWRARQAGESRGRPATTNIGTRARPMAAYRAYRRSLPPAVIPMTSLPTTEYAPEGTLAFVAADIAVS